MADVDQVLASLTLEEKVAQLSCAGRCYEMPEFDAGTAYAEQLLERLPHGVGQLGRPSFGRTEEEARQLTSRVQQALREGTRPGIGALFNEEGVHGLMGGDGTVFPSALGLAATWDPELVEEVYRAVGRETRASGGNYVYAPVLDLARDARWGRMEETFGENPHLVTEMGVAAVLGLQGRDEQIADDRVLACAKHFVGHGAPQSGSNAAPVGVGERELRRDHLAPFEAAVHAGVGAIMVAYHEFDGVPMHASRRWLTEYLRDELGFTGMVSSDGFGLPQLATLHRVAADAAEAARQAFEAGLDCEVPEPIGTSSLAEQVAQGQISVEVIDRACRNVLVAKNRLGLLDGDRPFELPPPLTDPERAAHRRLAQRAAEQAVVVLTNRGDRLPLAVEAKSTLLVCGPNAADAHLGGYTDPSAAGESVLDGIRARFGAATVAFEPGCRITASPPSAATWWEDSVELADPADDDALLEAAVGSARLADLAVVVVGGNEGTHREGWWFDHLGDRSDLTMTGRQDELVERVAAVVPTVAVVMSAGPVDLRRVVAAADAVVWTCYPGELGGPAIARVLAGDVDATGRLPITFPRSTGQIPLYFGRQPSAGRGYLHGENDPLFSFGHGLSYSTFELGPATVTPTHITLEGLERTGVEVRAEIGNTGHRPGSELVRIELQDLVASVAQPTRLVAFRRVRLNPGERSAVSFHLKAETFELIDETMERRVEAGEVELRVVAGGRSERVVLAVENEPTRSD